jgi:hypothetical protein
MSLKNAILLDFAAIIIRISVSLNGLSQPLSVPIVTNNTIFCQYDGI